MEDIAALFAEAPCPCYRHRGPGFPGTPATPPDRRVRIRRFGELRSRGSTLAQNLGQRALEKGKSVVFSTVNGALADLLKQESLPDVERRMKRDTTPSVLILDELGYLPCDARSGDLLYSIISRRHETCEHDHHDQPLTAR